MSVASRVFPSMEYLNSVLEFKDGILYNKITRNSRCLAGRKAGAICGRYNTICLFGQSYLLHRVAFYMKHGYCPNHLDHIDCDGHNNHIDNLRPATPHENQCNQGLTKSNKSGVKGLSWSKQQNKWFACIRYNGKNKNLGYFENKELGAEFLGLARDMLHGSFANHGQFKENIFCQ
jgi:hypothetical protein